MPRNLAKDILNEIEYMLPQELQKSKQIRQKFTNEEDLLIIKLVGDNQFPNWNEIAKNIPTKSGRQCRERFQNYLSPNLAKEPWTKEEDELIIQLYKQYGPSWSLMADYFGGRRTNNNIKNRWNNHLKSKFSNLSKNENLIIKNEEKKNIYSNNASIQLLSSQKSNILSPNISLNLPKCTSNLTDNNSSQIFQQNQIYSLPQNRNHFVHQQLILMNQQPLIRREVQHRVIRLRQQKLLQNQQTDNEKEFNEFFGLDQFNENSFNSIDYIFDEASDLGLFQNSSFEPND